MNMHVHHPKCVIFRHSKDNNFSTSNGIIMKPNMHHHTIVIYTQYTFPEISSIACLFMADDKKFIDILKPKEQ